MSPQHLIFLGLSWLEAHNPVLDWFHHYITFSPNTCLWSRPRLELNSCTSNLRKGNLNSITQTLPPTWTNGISITHFIILVSSINVFFVPLRTAWNAFRHTPVSMKIDSNLDTNSFSLGVTSFASVPLEYKWVGSGSH